MEDNPFWLLLVLVGGSIGLSLVWLVTRPLNWIDALLN